MLLSVRQLLNETDDDVVDTISQLTSLLLAVAEGLQRMRRAAQRALAACVGEGRSRDTRPRDSRLHEVTSSEDATHQRAMVPYQGRVDTGLFYDEDYKLTLVALESCDAAYRQIQVICQTLRPGADLTLGRWRIWKFAFD